MQIITKWRVWIHFACVCVQHKTDAFFLSLQTMAQYVKLVVDGYYDLMQNKSGEFVINFFVSEFRLINWTFVLLDPRVNDWFLMSSPFPTLFICLTYAYCVKVLGPKLMENRKPFDLKYVLIVYNLAQVIFSTWLFYEVSDIVK